MSIISPYIQELLNPGDTQVTEIKLNLFTLTIKDILLEKKFKREKLEVSIKHFRNYFVLLLIVFGFYILTEYLVDTEDTTTNLYYLIAFGIILLLISFTFSKPFKKTYYSISYMLVTMMVAIKVASDWITTSYEISLSAQFVVILGTVNKTNMNIIPVFLYNIGYVVQFCIRIIVIGIQSDDSDIVRTYSSGRMAVYSVSSIIIISVSIMLLQLYTYYRFIKQRRNDFLAREQIEQEMHQAQDILSILVPKFVQQSINTGVYTMQEA